MAEIKVFCIGPNKTGTTSFHRAFQTLGLKSIHDSARMRALAADLAGHPEILPTVLDDFDAFSDFPVPCFQELHSLFPEAYFLLNTRPIEDWVTSRIVHVLHNRVCDEPSQWRDINTFRWRHDYLELHKSAREFFTGNPRFAEINVCDGQGWDVLCPVLGFDVPRTKFPRENTTEKFLEATSCRAGAQIAN